MTGKEALWQQASRWCVEDYGIQTQYSQAHSMDCEYSGDWDCEKCWESEAVDMKKLYEGFVEHVDLMDEAEVRESIIDALEDSADSVVLNAKGEEYAKN